MSKISTIPKINFVSLISLHNSNYTHVENINQFNYQKHIRHSQPYELNRIFLLITHSRTLYKKQQKPNISTTPGRALCKKPQKPGTPITPGRAPCWAPFIMNRVFRLILSPNSSRIVTNNLPTGRHQVFTRTWKRMLRLTYVLYLTTESL